MSNKEAILGSFGALLRTQPTAALWLLSLAMAAQTKPVAQRVLSKYMAKGGILRELSGAQMDGFAAPRLGERVVGVRSAGPAAC